MGTEKYKKQWDRIDESINHAVKDTAYGYDSAARAASQFMASSIPVGTQMDKSLRAISGVAAMTNSSYDDISHVFTRIAGQGRLMAIDLNSLAARGLNVAATLGESMGKSESDIRKMVSQGKISFEEFAYAMDDAFGEHAKKGNDTFEGALANMKAALNRISAKFWDPMLINMKNVFNQLRSTINDLNNNYLDGFINALNTKLTFIFDNITKFIELGGLKNILLGFGNIFKLFGQLLSPIKNAFGEVFSSKGVQSLVDATARFKEFTANLKISEKTAERIQITFKALFKVVKTGINIFLQIASAALKLVNVLFPVGSTFLDIVSALAKGLNKLVDAFVKSNIVTKTLNNIVNGVTKAGEKVSWFVKEVLKFDKIMGFLQKVFQAIASIGLALGKAFASVIRNGDLKAVMDIFNTGLMGGVLVTVIKMFKNLQNATKTLGDTFGSIQGTLDGVKNILAAYQKEINSKTLLNIAKAVALLAASLFVLSLIPTEKIMSSLGALAGVMTEFMIMFKIFTKISGDVSKVGRSSTAMVSMALSITILASALKKMGSLNLGQVMTGLIGMAGAMTILMVALKLMPDNKKVMLKSIGLINMALAMNIMATALKKFGSIPILEITKGLLAMAGSMTILMISMNALPKGSLLKGMAMIPLTTSLLILGSAMEKLGKLSWGDIGRSLVAMAGSLMILVMAMNKLPKWSLAKATAMIPLTTSLLILSVGLKKLAQLSWSDIARSLTAMGGALTMLVLSTSIMSKMGAKTGGLVAASAALLLFAVGMKSLSKISWDGILRAFTALAIGITALVVAAHLLSPVAGTLMLVAGAMALFGVAAVAFGVGLTLIATGIGALGMALATGATAIVAGLSAILLGLLGLMPEIINIVKVFLIGVTTTIIEVAPLLAKALGTLVYEAVKMLSDYVPMICTAFLDLIINVFRALSDRMPEVIVSIAEFIESFFRGFMQAFSIIDPSTLMNGVVALAILTTAFLMMAGLALLVPNAMLGVLAFGVLILELAGILHLIGKIFEGKDLESLSTAGDVMMLVGEAIGKFVGGLAGGLAAGATNSLPQIAINLSEFITNLQPFLDGMKQVEPSLLGKIVLLTGAILALSAANMINGLTNLLSFGSSLSKMGTQLGEFATNLKPFIDMSSTITPNMMKGVNSLTGAIILLTGANIVKGISSFLLGKNSFAEFGNEIAELGNGMKSFVKNLGTFSGGQVKTIEAACKGITVLAEAGKKIPREGGVWGWLAGENSIGKFSSYLPDVGTNLNKFVTNLGTFTEAQVLSVNAAANAIKGLAEAGKQIPNEGGVWGWLAGDNSISKFSDQLPDLGKNLNEFAESLSNFDEGKAKAVECAANAISTMASAASEIPNSGGIVSWFTGDNDLAKFGSKLPGVGANITEFINSLGTFDDSKVNSVELAGRAITALAKAAADIPKTGGIGSWFTGDNDFAEFGAKLPGVGRNISEFVNALGSFDESKVVTTDCAGRAIGALSKAAADIPSARNGFWTWLLGDNSLASFGDQLPGVATNLASFVSNLGTFDDSAVTSADCAGRAIASLAEAANNIPAEGGVWQWLVGDKSIATFGDKLPGLGTHLGEFVKNLGTFTEDQVKTTECATNAIAGFAKAGADIPNNGGLFSLFTGNNDIKDFAGKLPEVGTALGNFIRNIGTFGEDQINTTNAAVNAMKALANFGSIDTGKVNEVLTAISGNLANFGSKLKEFVEGMSGVSAEDIEAAIVKFNTIIDLAKNIASISVDSISTFGDSLKKVGKESMEGFIEAFAGEEPKTKAVNGIKDLLMAVLTGAESKRAELVDKFESLINSALDTISSKTFISKVQEAGKYFAQGFADGINNNKYLAVDAGSSLGNAAYQGVKTAIDAHSPSVKAQELGGFFGEGFIKGLTIYGSKVYDESHNIGIEATEGLNKGISSIHNLISDSMDDLSIRPILDLSNIEAGASKIGGLFNNPQLSTNVGAIVSGMSTTNQNGTNRDVVSAINKLGSTLGNTGGDTYNINGITYGADGEISDAIGVLIRAANIERRS